LAETRAVEFARRVAEDVARRLEKRFDEYLVKVTRLSELMVKFARGEPTVTQSWTNTVVEIYVARDQRIATAELEYEGGEAIEEKLEKALRALSPSKLYAPLPEPTGSAISASDPAVVEVVESGDASEHVAELDVERRGDFAGKVEYWHRAVALLGSNGANLSYEATSFNGYVRVFRERASGQWSWTSTKADLLLAKRAFDKAEELAEECSKLPRERVEPGRYRVLLTPMIVGNLVERVVQSASAGSIIFGTSFFVGRKPGDKVFSELFSVYDRPRDTSLPFFGGFDDEGVSTADKPIVERGVLAGFLHNSKTARLMGAVSTGNAGWIMPRAFNVEISAGDSSLEELVESLRTGLYLTNNWYTRFQNFLEGTFSTVTRDAAFIVEGGRPKACTERVRIADSMPSLFSNVEALSKERWQIQWWEVRHPTRAPYMLFSSVGITTPE
jgi:PmbA protein